MNTTTVTTERNGLKVTVAIRYGYMVSREAHDSFEQALAAILRFRERELDAWIAQDR